MKSLFFLLFLMQMSEAPKSAKHIDLEKANEILGLSSSLKNKLNQSLSRIDLAIKESDFETLKRETVIADRYLSSLCGLQVDAFYLAEFLKIEVEKNSRVGSLNTKERNISWSKIRELKRFSEFNFKYVAERILRAVEVIVKNSRQVNTASLRSETSGFSI